MLTTRSWTNARWALLIMPAILCAGCGPSENVGTVNGLVTLNGEPLAGALIQFEPLAGNAPSGGITNEVGQYSLRYNRETEGAEIGEHRVRISTKDLGNPDSDPPRPKRPETVPAKYNTKTELTAKVQAGTNKHDFPLEGTVPEGKKKKSN